MNDDRQRALKSLLGERNVDRRTFVVTSLGAGFAMAVLPVTAQTITTSAEGLVAGEVKVPTKDGEMPAYRAMPATGGNFPVILVVQEVFGVHEHIKDVCRRLAKNGYFAIAPELYARQGDPSKNTDTAKLMSEIVAKVPDAQVMGDLDACVAYAKATGKADTARLGITGFCWGGRIVLMYAAHNPERQGGRRVVRHDGARLLPGRQDAARRRAADQGRRAGPVRRRRRRHSERHGREDVRGAEGRRQREVGVHDLSGHAARIPRRLPAELSQGAGRRCVEQDAGVVQAESLRR